MAFKKAEKITLEDLDRAHSEYQSIYKEVSEEWAALDTERDRACALINDIEDLIESIRHLPYQFIISRKKIENERKKFIDSAELKKKERKEKLGASAGSVAILGAGAAAAASFWEYIAAFFEKLFGKKLGKNYLLWIVVLIIVLFALVFLLIGWTISKWRTAKKAARNTAKIKKEITAMKIEYETTSIVYEETTSQINIVKRLYDQLADYSGESYMNISKEHRSDLKALKNHTETLAELLNKKQK